MSDLPSIHREVMKPAFPKTGTLFPEKCAIARACTGTHASKSTGAIYHTCKIIFHFLIYYNIFPVRTAFPNLE